MLSVVFLQLFLPWLGIYGYLFSLFFSELLNGSLSLLCLFRTTRFRPPWVRWLALPALSMALACLVGRRLVPGLAGGILFTLSFYLLLLYALGQVTRRDLCP